MFASAIVVFCCFLHEVQINIFDKERLHTESASNTTFSIQKEHATITYENDEFVIKPGTSGAKIKVNGAPLTGERKLEHQDRVLFGGWFWAHPAPYFNLMCSDIILVWLVKNYFLFFSYPLSTHSVLFENESNFLKFELVHIFLQAQTTCMSSKIP